MSKRMVMNKVREMDSWEHLEFVWLHFLWGFCLSDHMGDAYAEVEKFAAVTGLYFPSEADGFDDWLDILGKKGIKCGMWGKKFKQDMGEID